MLPPGKRGLLGGQRQLLSRRTERARARYGTWSAARFAADHSHDEAGYVGCVFLGGYSFITTQTERVSLLLCQPLAHPGRSARALGAHRAQDPVVFCSPLWAQAPEVLGMRTAV